MAEVDLHIVGAGPVINRKLQWVYSAAEEEAGRSRKANGEPIQKRRRLEKEAAPVVVDDYILLKRGVLTLLPSSPPASHDQQVRRPLPVSVSISEASSSEVSSSNFDEIEISLYTRKLDDGRCKLRATTGHRDEVRRLLRCAEIGSVDGIARVSCMLSVSPSPEPAWQLEVEVYWRSTVSPFIALNKATKIRTSEEIFSLCVAETTSPQSHRRQDQHAWSPKEFYEHVHVPPKCKADKSSLSVAGLTCQLFPFQTRAVRWLLSREGAAVDVNGRIVQVVDDKPPLVAFREVKTSTGERIMVSDLLNEVVQAPLPATELIKLDGGILAEEMGLGKTVELISLILLNKANRLSTTVRDDYTNTEVRTSGTTLIITPPSILEQWKNELSRHAPELSVMHYTGIKQRKCESEEIVEEFQTADVVLTTYTVLASEIHHAKAVEKRSLRFEQAYRQRLSPLVMLQWWRVCLDEAQMIESGVSAAAVVAQLIPRVNAWAVSGTPVKKDVQDLHGLLMFLRCHPFSNMRIWQRMIDGDSGDLKRLFKQIAMRHSKSIVRDELAIPAQKRIVVTVPFTAIEDSNYSTIFQEMCSDCGLDSGGAPLVEDWDPSSERTVAKMRDWLARLRQTCLHAEIGTRNRRALGRGNAPLRTVDEVLEVLVEQNETSLRSEERSALLARVMQGHLLAFGQDTDGALQLYRSSLTEATEASVECRQQVQDEKERIKKYRSESVKSEAVASDGLSEDEEDEDNNSRLRQYKQRLRHSLEVLHVCAFFTGTAYFQLKEKSGPAEDSPDYQALEREEIKCYDMAKSVRKELLADVTKKTQLLLDKVVAIKKKSFVKFPKVKDDIIIEGIESRKVADNIAILLALLNEQVEKIDSWRSKFTDLLVMKLVDQDEEVEITGDEYESSTKQQDEQYVYLEALRAAIADRQGLLSGQANALIDAEMRGAYKQAVNGAPNEPELKGPAPELFRTILEERMKFIQRYRKVPSLGLKIVKFSDEQAPFISARGLMTEIRSMITSVQWQQGGRSNRAEAEVLILESYLDKLQGVFATQSKALIALEGELDLFRDTLNQRLDFYRELQQISDQVAPLQEELSEQVDRIRLAGEQSIEDSHLMRLAAFKTKRRFLIHLRAESSGNEEERICIICQSSFEIGVLTICGHRFCKQCITTWRKQSPKCPLCKRVLRNNEFHDITYKPRELKAREEVNSNHSATKPSPSKTSRQESSIYTSVTTTTLDAIKSIDLPSTSSYGTKIDLICRTLLFLRSHDIATKSIVFSQYKDFLQVLGSALKANRIGYSSISDKRGISLFREDASVECFLLHAKADSSGLNLTNATHVFLCEPMINAAIELQAIARVHRIGQMRETTVWMFLVEDTVEEAIYEISVKRRLAHIQRADTTRTGAGRVEEQALDAANSQELQAAPLAKLMNKGQSEGEIVDKDDLWKCLFSKRKSAGSAIADANTQGVAGEEVARFLRAEAVETRAAADEVL